MQEQDSTIQSTRGETVRRAQDETQACSKCGLRVSLSTRSCPQDGTPITPDVGGLGDRYEFLDPIGQGGMSVIYKARQRALDRIVAIKMLHGHLLSEEIVRRFQQEAKAVSILKHPNIVAVHDFGVSEHGQPFMIMDFVEGKNLAQILKEIGEMPLAQCLDVFLEICDALSHAHDRGILHRDLKPGNIMLTTTSEHASTVRIVDFGIAKIIGGEEGSAQNLTQTGELFGSPLYMSPEQCAGKRCDQRSDIYSFGCMMYECLTGTVPLRGQTVMETIGKHMQEQPVLIGKLRPDKHFPPKLEDLVDKALSKNPDERYQSMHQLYTDLVQLQNEVDAGEWGGSKRLFKRLVRGNTAKIATVVLVALVVAFGAAALLVRKDSSKAQAPAMVDQFEAAQKKAHLLELVPRERLTDHVLAAALVSDAGLQKLDLGNAHSVGDAGMMSVANQTGLKILALERTKVGDIGLSYLQNLKELKDLSLRHTPVTDAGLAYVEKLTDLEVLSLLATKVTDAGVQHLLPLKHLRVLSLSETSVNGKSFNVLAQLPALQKLYLNSLKIADADIAALAGCKSLTQLELGHDYLGPEAVKALTPIKTLESLDLSSRNITDEAIQYLSEFPRLHTVELRYSSIDDAGCAALAKLSQVQTLALSHSKVTDKGVKFFVQMPKLVRLDLSDCAITDAGARDLSALKHVISLHLANTAVTDSGFKALGGITTLERLHIGRCKISDEAVELFKRDFPSCHVLRDN